MESSQPNRCPLHIKPNGRLLLPNTSKLRRLPNLTNQPRAHQPCASNCRRTKPAIQSSLTSVFSTIRPPVGSRRRRFRMRLSAILFGSVFMCAAFAVAVPPQDDDVRGAFLTSRPKEKKTTTSSTRPSRRRPKTGGTAGKTPDKTPDGSTGSTPPSSGSKSSTPSTGSDSRPVNVARLGLGLTLFSRDSNGLAVRVAPDRVFQKGDRVRILLETNADGYLYIFNRTNDGPVVMIYPDAELDEGGNYLQAHVPFEIPAA